jgi:hypothetical protein
VEGYICDYRKDRGLFRKRIEADRYVVYWPAAALDCDRWSQIGWPRRTLSDRAAAGSDWWQQLPGHGPSDGLGPWVHGGPAEGVKPRFNQGRWSQINRLAENQEGQGAEHKREGSGWKGLYWWKGIHVIIESAGGFSQNGGGRLRVDRYVTHYLGQGRDPRRSCWI